MGADPGHIDDPAAVWEMLFASEGLTATLIDRYDLEAAQALMAAAGQEAGFDLHVVVQNFSTYMDPLAIVKEMWADININLILEPKEYHGMSSYLVSAKRMLTLSAKVCRSIG